MSKLSILLLFCSFLFLSENTYAQDQKDTTQKQMFVIVKNDGSRFLGVILSQDAREVLIETNKTGQVFIPKHEIREIRAVRSDELDMSGNLKRTELFSTRYFITTNALPIEKGESYVQWNLYGPDFQFGISKNFGLGIMTSWVGTPIIGSAKYSIPVSSKFSLGAGTLLGTGSWAAPEFVLALPFVAATYGTRKANINLSFGYGYLSTQKESSGRMLGSIAGCARISDKISFVFDSFILLPGADYKEIIQEYNELGQPISIEVNRTRPEVALLIPGIRWQMEENKAFQFGFGGLETDGAFLKAPMPFLQWYRRI